MWNDLAFELDLEHTSFWENVCAVLILWTQKTRKKKGWRKTTNTDALESARVSLSLSLLSPYSFANKQIPSSLSLKTGRGEGGNTFTPLMDGYCGSVTHGNLQRNKPMALVHFMPSPLVLHSLVCDELPTLLCVVDSRVQYVSHRPPIGLVSLMTKKKGKIMFATNSLAYLSIWWWTWHNP